MKKVGKNKEAFIASLISTGILIGGLTFNHKVNKDAIKYNYDTMQLSTVETSTKIGYASSYDSSNVKHIHRYVLQEYLIDRDEYLHEYEVYEIIPGLYNEELFRQAVIDGDFDSIKNRLVYIENSTSFGNEILSEDFDNDVLTLIIENKVLSEVNISMTPALVTFGAFYAFGSLYNRVLNKKKKL